MEEIELVESADDITSKTYYQVNIDKIGTEREFVFEDWRLVPEGAEITPNGINVNAVSVRSIEAARKAARDLWYQRKAENEGIA